MSFTHTVRVRYAEVDQQGVVFNAHWLTYADDAVTRFVEHLGWEPGALWAPGPDDPPPPFDQMVRRAELDFAGSASFDDLVELEVVPTRLGTSSFDLTVTARVDGEPVVTVLLSYVVVDPTTRPYRSMPMPDQLRSRLEAARA